MATANSIPNDLAIHIVEKRMHVDALIIALYSVPTVQTFKHFKFVNSHIVDDYAKPGQVVLISPINSVECTIAEEDFKRFAIEIDQKLRELDESEKEVLAKRYDLLSNTAKYNGLLLGIANNTWNAQVNFIKDNLKQLEQSYVRSYNSSGNLKSPQFLQRRKIIFTKLNDALMRLGQPQMGGNLISGDIKRNLGLSSKSMIRQWNTMGGQANTIPGFAENYKTVASMAKNLKRVGYIGIALTGVEATANIQRACLEGTELECTKAKYVETGKGTGAVLGGATVGFAASYGLCSLVFSLPSAGTSFLWCGVVAGGVGGYAGAQLGGAGGGRAGKLLFETMEK